MTEPQPQSTPDPDDLAIWYMARRVGLGPQHNIRRIWSRLDADQQQFWRDEAAAIRQAVDTTGGTR